MPSTQKNYSKPWLSLDDQVQKLIDRGLSVNDRAAVKRFLAYENYYRFTGYCLRFQQVDPASGDRVFACGTTFEDVRNVCAIDRDLRDCFQDALELVEISLRSSVAYNFSRRFGAFGHLDPNNFASAFSRPTPSSKSRNLIIVPLRSGTRASFPRHCARASCS